MQTANPAATSPRFDSISDTLPARILLAIFASLFVALSAHASVPLPFTPVPLTFSDLAVLLVGLALGPTTAFAALTLYLVEGAIGLPVFSPWVASHGIARFYSQSGGYLIAYPFAAALVSGLTRVLARVTSRFVAALAACALGSVLIMASGFAWLVFRFHLAPAAAFTIGAAPFLYGQVIKILSAAGIFASFRRRSA